MKQRFELNEKDIEQAIKQFVANKTGLNEENMNFWICILENKTPKEITIAVEVVEDVVEDSGDNNGDMMPGGRTA